MSQRGSIYRYGLIVKKLKQKPYSTFEEIIKYIEHQLSFHQMDDGYDDLTIGLSMRTFQREVKNIQQLYGIQIEYSRKHKGYFIADSVHDSSNFDRMMDAFDIFNSLNLAQEINPYILLEKRKSLGLEHMNIILHALKAHRIIQLSYQKFTENASDTKELEPYAIKEFRNRWYLVAYEVGHIQAKIYAFDRIKSVEFTHKAYIRDDRKDVQRLFDDAFGIMTNNNSAEEVIIDVDKDQINYFKTLPLHHSQEIIDESENSRLILKLRITQDFIMELLSHSQYITIKSPAHLQEKMQDILTQALDRYGS